MALKILLADDSMTAQNMGKKILADAGYDVVAVSNGAAAIKKIASERPDIIILDVYMPGYTGLEVCERIKGARETAGTPVLLTVGKMEPFKPEDANKVKADGVMVKPFEATDLIAVVQSIGNRLAGGPPAPAKAPEASVRIPLPVPAAGAAPQRDTLRIPPPREAEVSRNEPQFDHEATIRLTPEQVKAFQDATYKDWVASTDDSPKAPEKTVAISAIPAAMQELEVKQEVPVLDPAPEQPIAPTVMIQSPTATAENTTISRAIGTHDIFTMERPATASPLVTELIEPEIAINTSVIYEPTTSPVSGEDASAQPFFSIEPTVALETPKSVLAAVEPEAVTPVEAAPEVAVVAPVNGLELETSAAVETAPMIVSPVETLETESEAASAMEVVPEAGPELEINSPIHLQPTVEVHAAPELEINSPVDSQPIVETQTDPALIPSDGDMSQFVTTFGVEKPEEIAVGMVSDLSEEQQAAILGPAGTEDAIEVQAVPVVEPAAVEPELEPEAAVITDTVPSSVMDEVGAIQTTASAIEPEVVAYVPGFNDTQRFVPAAIMPEDTGKIAAEEPVVVPPTVVEVKAEPVVQEPEAVVAYDPAEAPTVDIPASVMTAAAGAAFARVISPVQSAPVASETVADLTMPVEEAKPVEIEEPVTGDAELAEQLAAALENTQSEPAAHAEAVEAAIEPAVAAMAEPMAEVAKEQGWSDSKLSDAVARAIEHLKPQLISEILKELTK